MDDAVFLAVGLSIILIACIVSLILMRFLPRIRYLPSGLLLAFGLFLFLPAAATPPSGGGISGFGDLGRVAAIILGLLCILLAGATLLLSWLLYRWVLYRRAGRWWRDTAS